jgi:hypothetical protein
MKTLLTLLFAGIFFLVGIGLQIGIVWWLTRTTPDFECFSNLQIIAQSVYAFILVVSGGIIGLVSVED